MAFELKDDSDSPGIVQPSGFFYYQELEELQKICHKTLVEPKEDACEDEKENKNINNESQSKEGAASGDKISLGKISLCSTLCEWIYTPDSPIKGFEVLKLSEAKDEKLVQWALLKHVQSKNSKSFYLTFKGTDSVMDVINDIGAAPVPVCFSKDETDGNDMDGNDIDKLSEISVHSGVYCSLIREFHTIWKEIKSNVNKDKNNNCQLYVTGHSLGGGMAIVFGLISMIHSLIPDVIKLNNVKVIGIAPPTVIALEKGFTMSNLSIKNQFILKNLSNITHCIVNRFDIVPRIPFSVSWLKNMAPKIAVHFGRNVFHNKMAKSSLLESIVGQVITKVGGSTVAEKMIEGMTEFEKQIDKYSPILKLYCPIGNYYIFLSNKEDYYFTNNTRYIKKLLSHTPSNAIAMQTLNENNFKTIVKGDSRFQCLEFMEFFDFSKMTGNHSIRQYCQTLDQFQRKNNGKGQNDFDPESYIIGYCDTIQKKLSKFKTKKYECGRGDRFWKKIESRQLSMNQTIELQSYMELNEVAEAVVSKIREFAWWSKNASKARIILIERTNDWTKGYFSHDLYDITKNYVKYYEIAHSNDLQSLRRQMQQY